MLRTQRRSLIAIFCAFVVFGFAWLSFFRLDDPLAIWKSITRDHPEIDITFKVILLTGFVAFLMLLLGGLPVLISALRQTIASRQRNLLILVGVACFLSLAFVVVSILVITNNWGFDPNGGIYALIALLTLIVGAIAIVRTVTHSEPGERIMHFALFPAIILTLSMAISLLATIIEALLFAFQAPRAFADNVTPVWAVADAVMAVAIGIALIALWRYLHARPPTSRSA